MPVPYEYQCMELQLCMFELHLSRTSHPLHTCLPHTEAAVWRCPLNSHSHASHISAHFNAFALAKNQLLCDQVRVKKKVYMKVV